MKIVNLSFARAAAFALASMFATTAQAVLVTVDSVQYDVTTAVGTYPSLSATLQSQIWYGNSSLAEDFAYAVGGQLGFPASGNFGQGPFFAYSVTDTSLSSATVTDIVLGSPNTAFTLFFGGNDNPFTFAVVQQGSTVPDGGTTAAMLGLAMAGLISLRRRFA
jgi:hypothetical protein